MRLLYIPILSILISSPVAYGWTDREVAAVTCSIIGATRNMDGAIRIEKVNETRKELGKPPYLYGDDILQEALLFGVCIDLVLDNDWTTKLTAAQERAAEERRQREAREAEERRKAEAKRAEERRQREEREAEERQKAEAKKAEQRRKLEEEGFTCPSTAEERTNLIRMALDQGNTALYSKVVKCGKP